MTDRYDGVVEAVRYSPDGRIAMVRVFERRGPVWSDRLLLDRDAFIRLLKAKKRFYIGKRVEYMAGTFQVDQAVRLAGSAGHEVLVTGEDGDAAHSEVGHSEVGHSEVDHYEVGRTEERDFLEGAPLF
jgi:hypothetical protein